MVVQPHRLAGPGEQVDVAAAAGACPYRVLVLSQDTLYDRLQRREASAPATHTRS